MRPLGGDDESGAAAAPEPDSENAWDGEPRVIYSNVLNRVEHLKRSRSIEPFSRFKRRGGGDAGGTEGSTSADDSAAPSSERKNESSRQKWERQEDDRRFVEVVLDREEYPVSRGPLPIITVVDAWGRERRMSFRRQELEPLEVGSVVVMKEARSGAGLAAYLVGEEETQTFIVGNGVACAPTLLTQELHHASVHGVKDGPVGRSKLEGVFTGAAGGGGGAGGGLSGDNDESHDDEEEEMAEIRAQAFGLRHKALRRLLGSGEERRTPHELFRQAADMGDAESYFYLALLQSTGLHGEEPGGGQAQARTWALCGADAFNTNAYLLLAHRFHKGVGEAQQCTEAANFYQQATYGLSQGREDISQDVFPPPEAFRLGGEHGFGGWGLDIGEAEGFGAVGSGVGAKFSWTEVNGDGIGNGIGNGIGGGIGGGGAGEGAVLEAWPVDAGLDADVFLGAEDGFPRAMMLLGYLHMIGSERMAIEVNYAKAEELLWKAARQGESMAYSYLAWMHHNGYIGGHLPPHLQPPLPPGGSDPVIAKSWPGTRTEEQMKEIAKNIWGEETLAATSWGKGRVSKGGSSWGWRGWGAGRGDTEGGLPLKEGEDFWRGEESPETWGWEVAGGGVSGAIAAADLYLKGFQAFDPLSGTALADMWLHSEYTDSRDGRGAGGKWSMLQAYLLFQKALEMGREQGEPQTIAALRVGTMLEYGLVPYLGANVTKALEYYQESADSGGMDALIALAELNLYGHEDAVESSCDAAARLYKMYADLCVKDTFLAAGRIAFVQKRYQEAFFNYLIAAELGNKEGQASLAWLLDKAMASSSFSSRPDARSPLYRFALEIVESLLPSGMIDPDSGRTSRRPLEKKSKGVFGRKSGLEGVIEGIWEMGGDAREMARSYRRRAAEQGDADSRCEIADDLYRQATAMGAVPAGTGLLPWVKGRKSDDLEEESAEKGVGEVMSDKGEVLRLAREGDAMRMLDDAVEQYRLSCEAEGGGSKRGLFSMGWLHQHGVGVDLDRNMARDYYRRSSSTPAILSLWLMETSDVIADIGAPLALSAMLIVATVLGVKLFKGVPRRRQQRRPACDRGTGGVGDGRGISMVGDGANASRGEARRGATTSTRC